MKICGVICELNPFHNGHEFIFKEARRVTGADYVIAVMSGDFVQRGTPAICDKYIRTKMALMGGVDLVIELPVIYATASADYFALAGVSALDSLGCVDYICFGSETGDIEYLKKYVRNHFSYDNEAHILGQGAVKTGYRTAISDYIREGKSYAKAMSDITGNELASNDMLGACYIKSLRILKSEITPIAIKRRGSDYLDISDRSDSATGIRKRILEGKDISRFVPDYVLDILEDEEYENYPILANDFGVQLSTVLSRIIRMMSRGEDDFTRYKDVSDNIAGRIKANINDFTGYEDFIGIIHSKEYTKSRVMRALMHILLDIQKDDYYDDFALNQTPYIRILGFRRDSSSLLSIIKENCVIPIISKAKDARRILDDEAFRIFEMDIYAALVYEQARTFKYGGMPIHDYSKELIII